MGSSMKSYRELWRDIMFYRGHDRMPVVHWRGWPETRERWLKEGLPPDVEEMEYFRAVPTGHSVSVELGLRPGFTEETIVETAEYRVFRDASGVVQKAWKHQSNIPHYTDFTFKTARDWPEYKKRLQPGPERIPADLDEKLRAAEVRDCPIIIRICSLMGWVRNWMGVENFAYLMYDDPDVYADVVNTLADLSCWGIDQVVPRLKVKPDLAFGWEDISGKSGPFVSPSVFKRCVAPGYRKIRDKLESHGIHLMAVDSDGDGRALIGPWLEAGVNIQFPVEIGTWQTDPMELRRRYGRELRIIGGYNKLALEKGRAAIDAELERRLPLMKEGGFLLAPDHLITPGVPLADYLYYLDRVRQLRF